MLKLMLWKQYFLISKESLENPFVFVIFLLQKIFADVTINTESVSPQQLRSFLPSLSCMFAIRPTHLSCILHLLQVSHNPSSWPKQTSVKERKAFHWMSICELKHGRQMRENNTLMFFKSSTPAFCLANPKKPKLDVISNEEINRLTY